MPVISISTAAPAAFARSEGSKLSIKGYRAAAAPTPPTADVAINQLRRSLSIQGLSLIYKIPKKGIYGWKLLKGRILK
jgi:hypothetical protein